MLGLVIALAGVVILIAMMMRFGRLPTLARSAVVSSAFGLFTASRYVVADHSIHAVIFAIGATGIMLLSAVRQMQAYPPQP